MPYYYYYCCNCKKVFNNICHCNVCREICLEFDPEKTDLKKIK